VGSELCTCSYSAFLKLCLQCYLKVVAVTAARKSCLFSDQRCVAGSADVFVSNHIYPEYDASPGQQAAGPLVARQQEQQQQAHGQGLPLAHSRLQGDVRA